MKRKISALVLAAILSVMSLTACSNSNSTPQSTGTTATTTEQSSGGESTEATSSVDTSKTVNLIYYLWGGEGVANKDILAKINEKLKADINATLEIKYIDWPDVATKYPLLFASGEKFDLSHASPNAPVSYFTLASQDALVDITDMLNSTPVLKSEIPDSVWASTKYNGKIYAVPTLYSEFTPNGFVYRKDLLDKYGMSAINNLDGMKEYMQKTLDDGNLVPIDFGANDSQTLYRMFVESTGQYIEAPGIVNSEPYLVAKSAKDYSDIIHPAFTDEFEQFVLMTREWADKGYWSRDVMSKQESAKDSTVNGKSAGYITHMPDWTGSFGTFRDKLPGVQIDFWCFAEANNKIVRKMGVENSTVISTNSSNPERALMAIEKFMTEESYYRLIQNGIEGRQYELADGKIKQATGYSEEKDAGGFAVWALRTDRFNIPYDSEDPRRYELNAEWNKVAVDNPYVGFSFDPTKVTTEIASISNVNATTGMQLLFGKSPKPPVEALAEYRTQLENAGINKVIEEVKSQLANFNVNGQ